MTVEKSVSCSTTVAFEATKTLLIVGPQPPPMGGATATVQSFLAALREQPFIRVSLVSTRLPHKYRKKKFLFEPRTILRAVFILTQYLKHIGSCDAVLVLGNNSLSLTLVPVLLLFARLYAKSFYLKPIGGDLDLYLESQNKLLQTYLVNVLKMIDGVLPQTRQLQMKLSERGCDNTYYIPGYRPAAPMARQQTDVSEVFRLIFLSQIKREKGPLVLLEALRLIDKERDIRMTCDFYGPIYEEEQQEFHRELERTPGARYCGVAEVGIASSLVGAYDTLVLPTYFQSEGHPGVIIEAMQAGVPVISTMHRAIPELITHGENGLLVPIQDSQALAEAIKQMALDAPLRKRMGEANYMKGQGFRTEAVVPTILKLIFKENV
jgi:glycosyltransferase involved in cell wall biosynthesis